MTHNYLVCHTFQSFTNGLQVSMKQDREEDKFFDNLFHKHILILLQTFLKSVAVSLLFHFLMIKLYGYQGQRVLHQRAGNLRLQLVFWPF